MEERVNAIIFQLHNNSHFLFSFLSLWVVNWAKNINAIHLFQWTKVFIIYKK